MDISTKILKVTGKITLSNLKKGWLGRILIVGAFCFSALFVFSQGAMAETITVTAPKETATIHLGVNDPPVGVQLKGWWCSDRDLKKQMEKFVVYDVLTAKGQNDDLQHIVKEAVKLSKYLEEGGEVWPFTSFLPENREPFKKGLDAPQGGTKVYTYKTCYTVQELETIQKMLKKWAKGIWDPNENMREDTGVDREIKLWIGMKYKELGTGKSSLPAGHTITITVTRDKEKGKETGKVALPGGKLSDYKSPKDSVDWSNLDLAYKPPAPGVKDREWPGVKEGLSGPVIVQGKQKRDLVIGFYDSCGVNLAFINKRDIKAKPQLAQDLFEYAHLRGKQQLIKKIRDDSWGIKQREGLAKRLKDLDGKIAAKRKDLIARYGQDVFRKITDFTPDIAIIFREGIPKGYWSQIGNDINIALKKGEQKDRFIRRFRDLTVVYALDYVYMRRVQDRKSITPNDPLYLRSGRKVKSHVRGGFGIGLGGFSVGKRGAGIGGGLSAGKKRKSKGASGQWGLRTVGFEPRINPDSAWNIEDGSKKNVIVAIIDSGLDMTHPDGPQYIWTNPDEIPDNGVDDDNNGYIDDVHGWNFLDNNSDLRDFKGHGTFVTGIIAAKRNNGIGIAGINPGAQIMVLKVVTEKGIADSLNIWRALRYAADKGAKVINISLGEKGVSKLEQLGVNYAYSKGALVVVAGGNQADNISDYGPPALRRVLAVGALNIEGTRSVISNRGVNLGLIAPGEDIYSLHSKDAEWEGPAMDRQRLYFKESGTSFSAPFVTGCVSLMLAKNPGLTNREIEDILLDTATDINKSGWDSDTGAGLLNAYQALKREPRQILTLRPTEIIINRKKNRINSIDLFGIIKGNLDSYSIEIGNGKHPRKWKKVAGPLTEPVEYGFIARIDSAFIRSGKYYTLRITAQDENGNRKTAQLLISLKK